MRLILAPAAEAAIEKSGSQRLVKAIADLCDGPYPENDRRIHALHNRTLAGIQAGDYVRDVFEGLAVYGVKYYVDRKEEIIYVVAVIDGTMGM